MLRLNAPAPDIRLEGLQGGEVRTWTLRDFRGQWLVLFFYPADFTFVCPTELKGFESAKASFSAVDVQLVALSVDDITTHRSWVQELGGISYPLLADPERVVSRAYGVLDEESGKAVRATFIITPEGHLAHYLVSPMNVGRSVKETLRTVQALQTGRLCPADWQPGDPTLDGATE